MDRGLKFVSEAMRLHSRLLPFSPLPAVSPVPADPSSKMRWEAWHRALHVLAGLVVLLVLGQAGALPSLTLLRPALAPTPPLVGPPTGIPPLKLAMKRLVHSKFSNL